MYDKARKIHSADTFPPKTDFLLCAMFNDKHRPYLYLYWLLDLDLDVRPFEDLNNPFMGSSDGPIIPLRGQNRVFLLYEGRASREGRSRPTKRYGHNLNVILLCVLTMAYGPH